MARWLYKRTGGTSDSDVAIGDGGTYAYTASTMGLGASVEVSCVSEAGTVLWKKTISGGDLYNVRLHCAGTDLYLLAEDYAAQAEVSVFKFNGTTGALVWSKKYTPTDEEVYGGAICVGPAGKVFVAGVSFGAASYVYTLKIDETTGALLLDAHYDFGANADLTIGAIGTDGTSMYFGGAFDTSTAMWQRFNDVLEPNSTLKKVTWAGSAGWAATSITYMAGNVYVGGKGAILDATNNTAYKYTTGSKLRFADFGTSNIAVAEVISATETRIRNVALPGVSTTAEFSITGGTAQNGQSGAPGVAAATVTNAGALFSVAASATGEARIFNIALTASPSNYGTYDGYTYGSATATSPTSAAATAVVDVISRVAHTFAASASATTVADSVVAQTVTPMSAVTNGTIGVSLPKTLTGSLSVTGASGVIVQLPKLTGSFAGQNTLAGVFGHTLSSSITVIDPSIYGTLTKALPKITATMEAGIATLGSVAAALPRVTASAEALVGATGELATALPLLTSTITGGSQSSDMRLPVVTASLSGVAGVAGAISAVLTDMSSTLEGVLTTGGTMAPTLPRLTTAIEVIQGNVATISATLTRMTDSATGVIGSAGQLNAQLHAPVSSFQGSAAIQAVLAARLPTVRVSAFTSLRIYAHVLTHVMNTISSAVTTFENYEYNSFAKFNGRYLAAGPGGIVIVDQGDKDDTTNIDAAMLSGELDFNSPQLKRMSDFYLAMRAAGNIALTVSTDEMGAFDYTIKPYDIETIKQRRDLIGKGMRGRYWQFGLSNTDGCDFDFDAYSMLVVDTSRRV